MAKKEVRVVPVGDAPIRITAAEIQPGDVWTGDAEDITVTRTEPGEEWDAVPWDAARSAKPVKVRMVRIHGTITRTPYGDKGFKGTWSLQPDQPLEVLRG